MSQQNKEEINSSPIIYKRRKTIPVTIGNIPMGGDNPIRIQTMANVSTMDTEACLQQAKRVVDAHSDYLRYTAQGVREATNLGIIEDRLKEENIKIPLIADIHFNPKAAYKALETVEKVRVNPGNFVDTKTSTPREWTQELFEELHNKVEEKFGEFVLKAQRLNKAIRIGVNHGSLSERMVMKYGDTPEGMVQSALEFIDICRKYNFNDIVVSMKSSNVTVMTAAVRLFVKRLEELGYPPYPLHLGVTEAGEGEDGRVKSAVGIGSLLSDGIGDTIRVSLSEEPEEEVPVAKFLRDYIVKRESLETESRNTYSWQEYDKLRVNDRAKCQKVGNIIAGDIPIWILTTKNISDNSELKADYYLHNNILYTSSSNLIVKANVLTIKCTEVTSLINQNYNFNNQIIVLESDDINPVGQWRNAFIELRQKGILSPIVIRRKYKSETIDELRIMAAADFGSILLDGWANGIMIECDEVDATKLIGLHFGILQATRLRMTRSEFISCPGCGRTLFDLQTTVGQIKKATAHLKGLKIGVMGCIVNGPGEMADADYGYVGSAPGKIDMYKGQDCLVRGVPQSNAVETLIQLIKTNGDWVEPQG